MRTSLDKIFIADTVEERAKDTAHVVNERAKSVEIIPMAREGSETDLGIFRNRIEEALSNHERVMVIFDTCAGVRGEIIETLRKAEKEYGIGTRRILISCYGPSKIKRGFKKRGIDYQGIRQIRYLSDDPQIWMDQLDDLFNPNL